MLPSQATEERPANRRYSALECAGRFPTVPHPSDCVTFHLEEPDDIGPPRGHPFLQRCLPDSPWHTRPPPVQQHGFHAVRKENRDEAFQPRNYEAAAIVRRGVVQSERHSVQHEQWPWLDQQQSWLDWAEISLPQAGSSIDNDSGDEINLNLALSTADQAIPDLDSSLYADDLEQGRWGSDPVFAANKFVPPADQLSERGVTSIWKEYVVTSLKPLVNVLGLNQYANQLLIVGNHNVDLGFDVVESPGRGLSVRCQTPFQSPTDRIASSA